MLTPGQAVLASAFKAIARVPRSRREWLDANFFHGMFNTMHAKAVTNLG